MKPGLRAAISLLVVLSAAGPAHAQRATSFNRVTTFRREAGGSPARADRNVGTYAETASREAAPANPLSPYSSRPQRVPGTGAAYSLGNRVASTPEPPPPAQDRSVAHTYYPSMRSAQGPNRNVAPLGHGRCTQGRAASLARGAMGLGPGSTLPGPAAGRPHR
jgi:hypothetical protein